MKKKLVSLLLTVAMLVSLAVSLAVSSSAGGMTPNIDLGSDGINKPGAGINFAYIGNGVYRIFIERHTQGWELDYFESAWLQWQYNKSYSEPILWTTSPTHNPTDAGSPDAYISNIYALDSATGEKTDRVEVVDFGVGNFSNKYAWLNNQDYFYVDLKVDRACYIVSTEPNYVLSYVTFAVDIWVWNLNGQYKKIENYQREAELWSEELGDYYIAKRPVTPGNEFNWSCTGFDGTKENGKVVFSNNTKLHSEINNIYYGNEEVRFKLVPDEGCELKSFTVTRKIDGTAIAYQYDDKTGEYYFTSDGYSFYVTPVFGYKVKFMSGDDELTITGAPKTLKNGESVDVTQFEPDESYIPENKVFVGWYLKDGTKVTEINGSALTENVVLYAKYRYDGISVESVSVGGFYKENEETTKLVVAFGAEYDGAPEVDSFGIYISKTNNFGKNANYKTLEKADTSTFADNGYRYYTYITDAGTDTYYAKAYVVIDGEYYFADVVSAKGNNSRELILD